MLSMVAQALQALISPAALHLSEMKRSDAAATLQALSLQRVIKFLTAEIIVMRLLKLQLIH